MVARVWLWWPQVPRLEVVLVGDRHGSAKYVQYKEAACEEAGIATRTHRLGDDVSEDALVELVQRVVADRGVHGILVQLPLPPGINARRVLDAVPAQKDVDGLCSANEVALFQGRQPRFIPCTALVRAFRGARCGVVCWVRAREMHWWWWGAVHDDTALLPFVRPAGCHAAA